MPDNLIELADGSIVKMGNFEKDGRRGAVVELFGDLKRHDMGAGLAESIDEVGTGPSNFITKELWGVGSTPPYLHDGRATTLTEAIEFHGGEGVAARSAFRALQPDDREVTIAYLENLVLFKLEEEE